MARPIRKKVQVFPAGYSLFSWQKEDLLTLLRTRTGSQLIKYDAGLGKTILSICLHNVQQQDVVVVISPASMRGTWAQTWAEWTVPYAGQTEFKLQEITSGRNVVRPSTKVIFITYDLAAKKMWLLILGKFLQAAKSSLLICDESQNIRRWQAQRTKAIVRLLGPRATRVLELTATPYMNGVDDWHAQMSLLNPAAWGTLDKYCARYMYRVADEYDPRGFKYTGLQNAPELRARLKPYVIVRKESECAAELPPLTHTNLWTQVPPGLQKDLHNNEKLQRLVSALQHNDANTAAIIDAVEKDENVAQLRHELGEAKVPAAIDWIKEYLESSKKPLVVFAYHLDVISALHHKFHKQFTTAVITGSVPGVQRTKIVNDFQAGKIKLLIMNILAGGVGITVTAASTVLITEIPLRYSDIYQAYKRVHRIGQTQTTQIFYLLAKNTLDALLLQTVRVKEREEKKLL